MQYRIYKNFYPTLEKKMNRIAKKAAKYNSEFTFEIVDEDVEVVTDKETGHKTYYPFYIVEVDGTAKVGDYECVAVLEMHSEGNLIRRINNEIYIPERFLTSGNVCEHCGHKRGRKELYVVYNADTSEYKQVGSNCLALYTGGINPQWVASYYDCLRELEEDDGEYIRFGGTPMYDVKEVIGYATEIINKMGYFNSSCDLPTRYLVSEFYSVRCGVREAVDKINKDLIKNKFYHVDFDYKDFCKNETKELVDKIVEYYLSLEANTEFIHNVQILLKEGCCDYKHFGFLCYLPEGYNQFIKREVKRAEQKAVDETSEYFGEAGKRYRGQGLFNISVMTSWETDYGWTYMYKIVLDTGNILIWKSSNWYSDDELKRTIKIDFSIKDHSEYKGIKQTVVTRCKLYFKKEQPNPEDVETNKRATEDISKILDEVFQ